MKSYLTIKNKCHFIETSVLTDNKATAEIIYDKNKTYQTWLGFGGAVTEAAGYNYARLNSDKQQEVMEAYFSSKGLNYNFVRISMGSCDFSIDTYDYL